MQLPSIQSSIKTKDCLIPINFKKSTKIIDELLTLDDYKHDPELYSSLQNGDNTIQSIQSLKHYHLKPILKIPKKKYMESLIHNLKSGRNTDNTTIEKLNQPSIYCPENTKKNFINYCSPLNKSSSLNYKKINLNQENSITPSKIQLCGDNILNLDSSENSLRIRNIRMKDYFKKDENASTSSNYYIKNYFKQNKDLRNKDIKTIDKTEDIKWDNPLLKSVLPSNIKNLIQNNDKILKKKIKIFRNHSGIGNLRLKNKDNEREKSENIFHLKNYDDENNNKNNRYAPKICLKKNLYTNNNKYNLPIFSNYFLSYKNPDNSKLVYDFSLLLINKS